MKDKDRINIYSTIVKIQEIEIKHLKKELSMYRDKYKKLRSKYYRETRKN